MIADQQISLTCDTCHTLAGIFATHTGLAAWATRHGWDGETCPTCLMDQDAAERSAAPTVCECGCQPGQPCTCSPHDCECLDDCPVCDADEAEHQPRGKAL